MTPRAIPLRLVLLAGVASAMALVFVPLQRITTDLVRITTEQVSRPRAAQSAAIAARAIRAGARPSDLIGEEISSLRYEGTCFGACEGDGRELATTSPSEACAGEAGARVCVALASPKVATTPLRMAHALFLLVAIAVFSVTAVLLTLVVARPLRSLAGAARRVGEGKPALPSTGAFVEEIQDLEGSVAAMVDRLHAREVEIHERLLAAQASNDELQRTNRALADTRTQLLQAERLAAVGRLSAGLAHEIGNPLTAILSLLDLVITGDLPAAQQADFLQRIRAENERIAAIVRGLLDFSRPDAAAVEAASGACSPVEVVDDLIRFFEPQRRYAHVRLAVSGDLPSCTVRMHGGALRQVLLNLFLNAADALESRESPGLVLVAFEDHGERVRILVEDDGPGVEASVGDRLFEPFVTSKGDRGGTGLGLSVCRGLVEAVGGKLDLERTSPQGTRFALSLPATRG